MADVNDCTHDPYGKKEHLFVKDRDDIRFKVCIFCGDTAYRTDEDILADAKEKGIKPSGASGQE